MRWSAVGWRAEPDLHGLGRVGDAEAALDQPLLQRDVGAGVTGQRQATPVGLALVGAAHPVRQGRAEHADHGHRRRRDRQPPHHQLGARRPLLRRVEAGAPADHGEDQERRRDRQRGAPGRALQHVPPLDVGELVGDDHAHLVAGEVAQQGVEEDDVAAAAEPRDVGVGRGRPRAGVVDLHVVGLHARPARQRRGSARSAPGRAAARCAGTAARRPAGRATTPRRPAPRRRRRGSPTTSAAPVRSRPPRRTRPRRR